MSKVFDSMSKEQELLEELDEYYLSIKYNYSIPDIEKKMYKFISTNLKIDDKDEINRIIEELITKYEDDNR